MRLCENVYRRGGVYWWRRRLTLGDAQSSAHIRVSLTVRDLRCARELARKIGVEADRLRSVGMITVAQQTKLLKAFIDQQVGHFDGVAGLFAHQNLERGADAESQTATMAFSDDGAGERLLIEPRDRPAKTVTPLVPRDMRRPAAQCASSACDEGFARQRHSRMRWNTT